MNKIFAIGLTAVVGLFSSCDDWLTLTPENAVPAAKYWSTKEEVAAGMTGIYVSAINLAPTFIAEGEVQADFMTIGRSTLAAYDQIRNGNIQSTNTYAQWSGFYTVINNCNLLLERADKALETDPSFPVEDCERYKAQARVIRAWMYFYLIRLWKDVPYVTWAYFSDETDRNVAPSPQLDILQALISDLEEVQNLRLPNGTYVLPYSYGATVKGQNKGQATMYFLKALLADMYRMKGAYESDEAAAVEAYQKCVNLCEEIIQSGQFALVPVLKTPIAEASGSYLEEAVTHADSCFYLVDQQSVNKWFDEVYVKGNSSESIFELQADDYTAVSNFFDQYISSSSFKFAANEDHLLSDFFIETNNGVAKSGDSGYEDIRMKAASRGAGSPKFIWKIAGSAYQSLLDIYQSQAEYKKNVIVYRLAEIYLMEAEALNQIAWLQNGINGDSDLLSKAFMCVFKVRDRACAVEATDLEVKGGIAIVKFWDELNAGQDVRIEAGDVTCVSMQEYILGEQARELAFEGKRWFDLLRHAERTNTNGSTNLNYLLNQALNSSAEGMAMTVRTNWQNPDKHYLPYPHNDVLLNDLLSQKPAYGVE